MSKVTEEELLKAKELNNQLSLKMYELGNLQYALKKLNDEHTEISNQIETECNKRATKIEEIVAVEKDLKGYIETIETKYGTGYLNLDTGEIGGDLKS